jgi:hypothetical protein
MFVLFIFTFGAVPSLGNGRYGNVSWYQAKQCCGSGMFILDPDFSYPGSCISNLTTTKKRGKFFLAYFFGAISFAN